MPSSPTSKDLKSAISTALRRQHLLGAIPPAQRFLPVAALAVGDFVARKLETENVVEGLIFGTTGSDAGVVALAGPAEEVDGLRMEGVGSTIGERCLTCSMGGLKLWDGRTALEVGGGEGVLKGKAGKEKVGGNLP